MYDTDEFALDVTVHKVRSEIDGKAISASASEVAQLNIFGGRAIESEEVKAQIPSDYPVNHEQLLKDASIIVSAKISKDNSKPESGGKQSYKLDSILLRLAQKQGWRISETLSLVDSSLALTIFSPLEQHSRKYEVEIYTKLRLNGVTDVLEGRVTYKDKSLKVSLSSGNIDEIWKALFAGSKNDRGEEAALIVPEGCPVELNKKRSDFQLNLEFSQAESGSWALKRGALALAHSGSDQWKIGDAITISELGLSAVIETTGKKVDKWTLTFYGKATIDEVNVQLSVTADSKKAITVRVAAAQGVSPKNLITAVVPYGMKNEGVNTPPLPSASGLAQYTTTAAFGEIKFAKHGTQWGFESAAIEVATGTDWEWSLIEKTLKLKQLAARLEVKKGSGPEIKVQMKVQLRAKLLYNTRDASGQELDLVFEANKHNLTLSVDPPERCGFSVVVYVTTGGQIALPHIELFPDEFRIKQINLELEWGGTRKEGRFKGICHDWTIASVAPSLASVKEPRIELRVGRGSSLGKLAGDCMVLKVKIPVTYDLPKGPLKIFGLDARKIKEIVTRLKKLFEETTRAIRKIADIVKDLTKQLGSAGGAGAAGAMAEAAQATAATLIGLGAAAGIVYGIMNSVFGHDGRPNKHGDGNGNNKDNDNDHNDDNQDPDTRKGDWLIVGPGLSNGSPGSHAEITIYPKKPNLSPLTVDVKKLSVSVVSRPGQGEAETTVTIDTFTKVTKGAATGYVAQYTRPADAGEYQLKVRYEGLKPALEIVFRPKVEAEESKLVAGNSILRTKSMLPVGVTSYAVLYPRDQFGHARLGYEEDINRFKVSFTPDLKKHFKLVRFSDSIRIDFRLSEVKLYRLDVQLDGQSIANAPATITAQLRPSAQNSVASGDGLTSGIGGKQVEFELWLKGYQGEDFEYIPPQDEGKAAEERPFRVYLSSAAGGDINEQELEPNGGPTKFRFSYTRPEGEGKEYWISVTVDGKQLPHFPMQLMSTNTPPEVSVKNSILYISRIRIFTGQAASGTIIAYDTNNTRRARGGEGGKFKVEVDIVPRGKSPKQAYQVTKLVDNNDGTYTFNLPIEELEGVTGALKVSVRASALERGWRVATTTEKTSFDLLPVDQYGFNFQEVNLKDVRIIMIYGTAELAVIPGGKGFRATYERVGRTGMNREHNIIRIQYKEEDIPESPYIVQQTENEANTHPGKCIAVWQRDGEEIDQEEQEEVTIYAVDQYAGRRFVGGEEVSARWEGSEQGTGDEAEAIDEQPKVKDNNDGTYTITYLKAAARFPLNVSLNGEPIKGSPFAAPRPKAIVEGMEANGMGLTRARVGQETPLKVTFVALDGGLDEYAQFVRMVIFPKTVDTQTMAADKVIFPPLRTAGTNILSTSYTVPDIPGATMTGTYILKLFQDFTLADIRVENFGQPKVAFEIDVIPHITFRTEVSGLPPNWYGPVSAPGTYPNSFHIITNPPAENLFPDAVKIEQTFIGASSRLYPQDPNQLVEYKVETIESGKIKVVWGVLVGGVEVELTLFLLGHKIPVSDNKETFTLFPNDASNALTCWQHGYPSQAYYQKLDPNMEIVPHQNDPCRMSIVRHAGGNVNQWAGMHWSIPSGSRFSWQDRNNVYMFLYQVKLVRWAGSQEVRIQVPMDLEDGGNRIALIRYIDGKKDSWDTEGERCVWTIFDRPTGRFTDMKRSDVGSGKWINILYLYSGVWGI
ncbi:hypothetical protein BDZ91DRAFT_852568 [Kalaharituber pfeilii]|nr:hypothetical protein BDZ91DRAFT_852568 [Kalaharituber pfeilii]